MIEIENSKEYKVARNEWEQAFAAIVCAQRKPSRANAWEWANIAAHHAEHLGVTDARELLGDGNYPNLPALECALSEQHRKNVLIVCRHLGTVDWLARRGYQGRVVDRAVLEDVLDKHVIGSIPLHLAACAASVTQVVVPNVPQDEWGRELSAAELDRYGTYMRTYVVREMPILEPY